ncbi:MAG: hypothetical protein RR305_11900 [Chryseobacterium sp.]
MMKILRFIFAIPLGIIFSIFASIIFGFFIKIFNYFNTTLYEYSEWFPKFMAGIILVVVPYFIAPSKRKIFLFASIIIGILAFILNKIYFDLLEFAFLIGILLGTINIFLNPDTDQ